MKWNLNLIPQKSKWGHLNWTFHLLTPWCPFVITLSPHLTSATQTHLTDIKWRSGPLSIPYCPARKRYLTWNQSPKQEVEEKKKRHKFRVKTDLNPNPRSSTLWPRATLSWSLSFLICKTGTITPTSESACCKQSAVNCNCFPFLSFFSKAHGKNPDQ